FVKKYGNLREVSEAAFKAYASEVRSRAFPGPDHVYSAKKR
ncbi:MAG TPA: 3-methyl-2-oxobutanoate hydroxymethyltransferase, partial [Oceanicaulis sp.]|nr:3-methyl-2-oxobutanoate hydroxymethyltransferase [Oceanicaulis sp.]